MIEIYEKKKWEGNEMRNIVYKNYKEKMNIEKIILRIKKYK